MPKVLEYDLIVVGSGFFGSTIARLVADSTHKRILIIERRFHPGGNSWSKTDPETGIEFHAYGSHLFHTSNERVWKFVNRFSSFNNYKHQVFALYSNKFFPIPINLLTLYQFFGKQFSPETAREFLQSHSASQANHDSFESAAISSIGPELYEAFFRGYTHKQWQTDPKNLPRETFSRIPVRLNFDMNYFSDKYEGLPTLGYGQLFDNLLDHHNIDICLNTDYFELKGEIPNSTTIVYTGPLDRYFNYEHGELGWRTLDFEVERLKVNDYQGNAVVNYPDTAVPFTRIHEFKHLHPERSYSSEKTLIMKEFSRRAERADEPYYPINSLEDRLRLENYRKMMSAEENVIFGGRLGTYKYLDMHMAIASALTTFETKLFPRLIK